MQILTVLIITNSLTGCSALPATPLPAPLTMEGSAPPATPNSSSISIPLDASWQIQYSGEPDLSLPVDVYNLDLFDTSAEEIAQLHARGVYIMCYFSAGSREDWRPDTDQFPASVIGRDYKGWPGEKWLDVRAIEVLAPVLEARIRLAAEKGCDGVDPDNVNGFENETGFPISYADQLEFNQWLAQTAHVYGLGIGLKNDFNQINDLVSYFDWALNEECFSYNECELLLPFREAGKPVFVIEYETKPEEFCPQAQELGLNTIYKNWELDAFREACR